MERTGLIGHPVSHSLSPLIHAYWFERHGIAGEYGLYDIAPDALDATLKNLREKTPLRGVNVTVPHKQAVMECLDSVDDTARAIGAVNTITARDGKWHGTNTDAYGFMAHLKAEMPDWQSLMSDVVVVGAGGAARGVVYALKEMMGAARITLVNRTLDKAQALAEKFHVDAEPMEDIAALLRSASLLVNTSSAGMKGQPPLLLPMGEMPHSAVAYDIVYAPLLTPLLAEAHAYGLATVDGLGMLLYQAQGAFAEWWGVTPEVTPELRALLLERV